MAWPAPSRENHRKVRPQGSQVLKGLGFSALRFDFKKEMRKEHLRIRKMNIFILPYSFFSALLLFMSIDVFFLS